jgi:GT2 family glycosyltransferase
LECHINPKISVIIPVHNGGNNFRVCLASLTQCLPHPNEIIVVADGESDGSWHVAEDFNVTVIKRSSCGGPAKARNLGAKTAKGDILLFIDADVEVPADIIGKVIKVFETEPHLAALIGSYDDAPGASNFLSQYKNLFHHYTHQTASSEASTFWGACGAIRRNIFLAFGGFDDSYRLPCVEDIELGYRLTGSGYKIQLDKTLQVKHLKRWSVISLLKADFFYRALPWTQLLLRDRRLSNDLNLKWSSRLSIVLVYGLIGSLVSACWWTWSLLLTLIVAILLFILNVSIYQFFHSKRGFFFAIKTIYWHWFYYFYGGLALGIGAIIYLIRQFHTKFKRSKLEKI